MRTIIHGKNNKAMIADIYGAISAVVFVTAATIVGEFVPVFKNWLKTMFTHHWIGKGVLAVVVFWVVIYVSYKMIGRDSDEDLAKNFHLLSVIAAICAFLLLGFFIYEGLHV